MAFCISSRMAAIGLTFPKIYRLIPRVFWHSKHWRQEGVFDTIMATLHSQVREQIKKTTMDKIDSD